MAEFNLCTKGVPGSLYHVPALMNPRRGIGAPVVHMLSEYANTLSTEMSECLLPSSYWTM